MSTQLIAHLKEKCQADDNVKILLSQWEFDQKLVGKALENIGGFYPHFSNHNASHSQQILVNIERILGKDIELLSATDTWLILEAAYWHDIGMLVDAKNAKAVHENADFLFMIKTIANDKGHDLNLFCKAYEQGGWNDAIGSEDHPFDGVEKYRQLIAEWFRRNHDKRIGNLVTDPFSELGISSPRTELLPNRLYRYLGQICMSHGMDFQKVMEKLPYKQTGLGVEDCHPRFVGCLLRLGDLFDLDDNRFCPVMAKHVSNMPSLSQHHKDKHLSLREFQLDKRTVKLVAECPDEMSYVETQNWFGWIREEFQNQMSQWNLIVPHLGFGSLPTIEQLDVRMVESKILLDNKPMKFSLDENSVIEILEGSGIYKDKTNIYRELIQNAIDATLMRVWLNHHSENRCFSERLPKISHPLEPKTRKILDKYPIQIDFKKLSDIENSDDSLWEFILKDQGMGITLNDLKHMQKIAGSGNNHERQKLIEKMPLWMRPSGQFGIGLHSAFLLMKDLPDDEQKIVLTTKSVLTNKSYTIEMYSPLCKKKGYCFITELDDVTTLDMEWGTTLTFKMKQVRRGKRFHYNPSKLYQFLEKSYDPLLEEGFDNLSVATTVDDILEKVLRFTPVPVMFGDFWQKSLDVIYDPSNKKMNNENLIWSIEHQLYFQVSLSSNNLSSMSGNYKGWFKGQLVDSINVSTENLFHIGIIFYGLQAKDSLNIDRKNWKNDFVNKISEDKYLENLGYYFLENHKAELEKSLNDDEKLFSLFAYIFDPEKKLNIGNREKWKELPMFSKIQAHTNFNQNCNLYEKSFYELIKESDFSIIDSNRIDKLDQTTFTTNDIVLDIHSSGWIQTEFDEAWYKDGGVISFEESSFFNKKTYTKENNSSHDMNNNSLEVIRDFKFFLTYPAKRKFFNEEWLKYNFFKEFSPLFCISLLTERLVGNSEQINRLILPFIFEVAKSAKINEQGVFEKQVLIIKIDHLDLISQSTWEARNDKFEQMTQIEFTTLYHKLITDLDKLLENEEEWTKARELGKVQ